MPHLSKKERRKREANKRARAIVDGLGRPVPPRLMEAFQGRKYVLDRIADIEITLKLIEGCKETEWGSQIDVAPIRAVLKELRRDVPKRLPYSPCPCDTGEPTCPMCKERRWLTQSEVKELFGTPTAAM
jgi:hypothetical protein